MDKMKKDHSAEIETSQKVSADDETEPGFSEELSDGGERDENIRIINSHSR